MSSRHESPRQPLGILTLGALLAILLGSLAIWLAGGEGASPAEKRAASAADQTSDPVASQFGSRSSANLQVPTAAGAASSGGFLSAWAKSGSATGATTPSGAPAGATAQMNSPSTGGVSASASGRARPRPADSVNVGLREQLEGVNLADRSTRKQLVANLKAQEEARLSAVRAEALRLGLPIRTQGPGSQVSEIVGFKNGEPVYVGTFNRNAAISTGADVLRAPAPVGRGLNGQFADKSRLNLGIWDAGWVRSTHQEFGSRVTYGDDAGIFDDHGTHVGGTMVASGVVERAMGMAPAAALLTHDWNFDMIEMAASGAAAATDTDLLPISNHSYGIISGSSDMGVYETYASELDATAYALPYYLSFWSAGNDQGRLRVYNGFQSVTHHSLSKNVMTVGAVEDAMLQGERAPFKALMSDFSSWGPTDDGRIKPDVVANGVTLYSPVATGNAAYDGTYSGTSMASPNAAGTAAQSVQLFVREFAELPRADLLKALIIHTADDLGSPGPDYQYGWGLVNGVEAAELIEAEKASPNTIFLEGALASVAPPTTPPSYSKFSQTFFWDGLSPIKATLVWIDPAGVPESDSNSRAPNLVHDLDLSITAPDGSTVHRPFVMPFVDDWTYGKMSAPAVEGRNKTDNVEQILIAPTRATAGQYTLEVSVTGDLVEPAVSPAQAFHVVLTGAGTTPPNLPPTVSLSAPLDGASFLPGDPVSLSAAAQDANGIRSVAFYAGGARVADGVFDSASGLYTNVWTPPTSSAAARLWRISARAVDDAILPATNASSSNLIEVYYPLPGQAVEPFTAPTADGPVWATAGDGSGRLYIGGDFSSVNGVAASHVARLTGAGAYDDSFLALDGPEGSVRSLLYSQRVGALYVGGDFARVAGQSRPALARLAIGRAVSDGTLDASFSPALHLSNSASPPSVRAITELEDGKLVVGGNFSHVNGQATANLCRLLQNGSNDPTFIPPKPNGMVHSVFFLPDGRFYAAGSFTSLDGGAEFLTNRGLEAPYGPVVRSNASGIVGGRLPQGWADNSLSTSSRTVTTYSESTFATIKGSALRVTSDLLSTNTNGARFEIGQPFQASAGRACTASVWLKSATPRSVTLSFKQVASPFASRVFTNISVGTNWQKFAISASLLQTEQLSFAISGEGQTDITIDEATCVVDGPYEARRLVRLHGDGAIDRTFSVGTGTQGGFNNTVHSVAVAEDGSVYAGGSFSSYQGNANYNGMAKLGPDGQISAAFNFSPGLSGEVRHVRVMPNGQILAAGAFTNVGNSSLKIPVTAVGRILQFNPDGTLDNDFNPGSAPGDGIFGTGADGPVNAVSSLANGNVLAAGGFDNFNGSLRKKLAVVAGVDALKPTIVSRSSASLNAGSELDFAFASSSPGTTGYSLLGTLPRGLKFDPVTGRLTGVPLDSGVWPLQVVATSPMGNATNNFQLNVGNVVVPYESWKKAWFSSSDQANPAVSGRNVVRSAATGLPNLLVYALDGGNPATLGPEVRPLVAAENIAGTSYLTLTATKFRQAEINAMVGHFSTNLSTAWTNAAGISNTASVFKVRAPEPTTNSLLQLLRISVTSP